MVSRFPLCPDSISSSGTQATELNIPSWSDPEHQQGHASGGGPEAGRSLFPSPIPQSWYRPPVSSIRSFSRRPMTWGPRTLVDRPRPSTRTIKALHQPGGVDVLLLSRRLVCQAAMQTADRAPAPLSFSLAQDQGPPSTHHPPTAPRLPPAAHQTPPIHPP